MSKLASLVPLLRRLRNRLPHYRVAWLFLAVVGSAYLVRSFICHREMANIAATYRHLSDGPNGPFVPYLVESAMMFGYTQDVALGRGLPHCDRRLGGMEQMPTGRQFTNGLEYFFGWGYRLRELLHLRLARPDPAQAYEDDPGFAPWLRRWVRLWASLVAGLVFLWLIALRCPQSLAVLGGLLHAVAPAAIARYTGQDLVRGSFCLPLLTACFVLAAWQFNAPRRWKLPLLGLLVFLALATWDMCQIVFGLWGLYELIRLLAGGRASGKRRAIWLALALGTLLAALLVPYHREHRLIASPLVLVILPLVLLGQHLAGRPWRARLAFLLPAALLCCGAWLATSGGMSENYGHFGKLLAAKLRFGNIKPPDPALLPDFESRVLWTPAMHSADRNLLRLYFPMAIYATLVLLALVGDFRLPRNHRRHRLPQWIGLVLMVVGYLAAWLFLRHDLRPALPGAIGAGLLICVLGATNRRLPLLGLPLFMSTIYFIAFFYIVRYHEFAALFLCILLPLLAAAAWHNCRTVGRVALTVLLLMALLVEARRSWDLRRSYQGTYFEESAGLIAWLRREGIADVPVLADFSIGPALKAYCGAKIFLQPQFELPQVRRDYERFVRELFLGTERTLREYCDEHGAELFVFDRGWAPHLPLHIYSARYMAGAKVVAPDAPSAIFSRTAAQRRLRGFYELKPPPDLAFVSNKYLLFKVISRDDYERAKTYVRDARAARAQGDLVRARTLAKAAAYADPASYQVRIIYAELFGEALEIRPRGY